MKYSQQLPLYFESRRNRYWTIHPTGKWCELDKDDACMLFAGPVPYSKRHIVPQEIIDARKLRSVAFAGSIAGYNEGLSVQGGTHILVTSSPRYIAPKAGDWEMLGGILVNMFGTEQLPYVYGWIKIALKMFTSKQWMAGQVLVLCGPAQSGKNLFAFLLQKLFGGRAPGKPYDYMTQQTSFNSDFMGCELLTIEDEVTMTGIQARRAFGARIKDVAVNQFRRLHRKHAEAITVIPLQRLIISLNDEPERLQILPPIEPDIADKLMLIKVFKHEMPMPTNTPKAMKEFASALEAQLPAFVDFIQHWEIPEMYVSNRYGVAHYHHPDILDSLHEQSPEEQMLELIDETLFSENQSRFEWIGQSKELCRELKNSESRNVQRESEKLLPTVACCGKYLSRLAERHPKRVIKHAGRAGTRRWTINAPEKDDEFGSSRSQRPDRPAFMNLLALLRERSEARKLLEADPDN